MMKINIEHCINQSGVRGGYLFTLQEFVKNLKEMRTRIQDNDNTAITEFFSIYHFNGDPSEIMVEVKGGK